MHSCRSMTPDLARIARTLVAGGIALVALLASPSPALAARVFIDPGHGGIYPGAVYGGVEESYVNLLLASSTSAALRARGYTVGLSRTSDTVVRSHDAPSWHKNSTTGVWSLYADGSYTVSDDLQARCDAANAWQADVFVCIHCNAAGTSAHGTETLYNGWSSGTDSVLSRRLATDLQAGVTAAAGTSSRGTGTPSLYVDHWTNMPGALVEVAFLSNPAERAQLLSSSFRAKVARGIADALDRYFASDPYTPLEPRIGGTNRYDTAVRIAKVGWPTTAGTVLLASGERWPDALAAAPLSRKLDAPLLLAPSGALPAEVANEIAALKPTHLIVLGGTSAVATGTATAAASAAKLSASAVRRVGGADRYETARLIAEQVGTASHAVTVVSGEGFADAVSAASFSARSGTPVLLTARSALSTATERFVTDHDAAIGSATVVGGTGAVSAAVTGTLAKHATVTRIAGADRYATSLAVLQKHWPSGTISPYVATGADFPDALAAGTLAAKRGQPVLLLGRAYLPASTREFVLHSTTRISGFTMVGSSNALSHLLEWELAKARVTQ